MKRAFLAAILLVASTSAWAISAPGDANVYWYHGKIVKVIDKLITIWNEPQFVLSTGETVTADVVKHSAYPLVVEASDQFLVTKVSVPRNSPPAYEIARAPVVFKGLGRELGFDTLQNNAAIVQVGEVKPNQNFMSKADLEKLFEKADPGTQFKLSPYSSGYMQAEGDSSEATNQALWQKLSGARNGKAMPTESVKALPDGLSLDTIHDAVREEVHAGF